MTLDSIPTFTPLGISHYPMSICPSFHLFIHPSIYSSIHPSIPFFSSTYLVSCRSVILPVGEALKTYKGCAWKHPGQMPEQPQTNKLRQGHELLWKPLKMSEHLTLSLRLSPATLLKNLVLSSLYPWAHPFSPIPKTMTIGESWNVDLLINWELSHSIFLSPVSTLNLFFLKQQLRPPRVFTVFKVLILFWTASHYVANIHSACCRSLTDDDKNHIICKKERCN